MATPEPIEVARDDVLRFRFRRHDLDRTPDTTVDSTDLALLDYGVQDTGPDGAAWAMAVRGVATDAIGPELAMAWTIRGAPHVYRRSDLAAIAVATSPLSEADAAKRIFDASRPLKDAGIGVIDALVTVADLMRDIVDKPTVKGDVSGQLTERLDEPFLRFCRPCDATHIYEQPFRLAALQAGLELEPGTSPPVLHRVDGLDPPRSKVPGTEAEPRFDVARNYIRFYGPALPRNAATFLDSTAKDVKANWPTDTVAIAIADVDTGRDAPHLLAEDVDELTSSNSASGVVRLLGPYDPYLQLRDRELLVPDEAHRKDLWRVLGRPGAIVEDGAVIGTWRPKSSGKRLAVRIEPWQRITKATRSAIADEAQRLAAHRGVELKAIDEE